MINFRYEIIQKLGEGGSGEVFLVEDTLRNNQQMALKVLHSAEKVGAESDEAFRNEVSALSSLTHPNLIRIFDFGIIREAEPSVLEQRRFFTMELIRGKESNEWAAAVTVQKEKERLLELLLLQALSVLSYVHREGIIHFDVKPQNLVLVGELGAAAAPLLKLTDFGFAKQQEETTDVQVRGTLEYTAPEMIRGQAFDTRVDLYSLGATFFHLIEGHCPFEAASPVDLVKRVLTEEPVFKAPALPEGQRLRHVLLRLLEKDPQKRFRDAEDAARSLVADMPKGEELLESYFGLSKQPKFVGRKTELRYFTEALSLVGKGQPLTFPAIVLSGEEGIGKSSLLRQAIKVARSLELTVLESEAIQNDIPFSSIARILQLLISEVRSYSSEGKELFARNQVVLGLQQQIEPATLQVWAQEKEKYVELISRFILEAAQLFPFALVADNIQLMDEQSVGVLRTVIRDVRNGNILLLAGETSDIAQVLPSALAHEISLGELSQNEVTDMSISVLGYHEVSKSVGSSVYDMYGGTPVIVVEALNAVGSLIPKEALYDVGRGQQFIATFESQLPRDIDDFMLARYRKLARERQLILSILSCFQNPASSALVLNILPFHKQRSRDQLRYLQLDGFVGASETNELLMIRMKRLKDGIYASIVDEHHDLHTLVAAALESSPGENSFTQLQELGYQFAKAGDASKAAAYYEQAADEGLRLFAFQRALQLFDEAIKLAALAGNISREMELKAKYVGALFKSGLYRESVDLGRKLVEGREVSLPTRMALSKAMGLSLSRLGETDQAQEFLAIVLQLSQDEGEQLELKQELVGLEISAGRFQDAERESLEQLEHARKLNNTKLMAAIHTDLGISAFFQDRFDYAAECFGEALKKYEELNEKTQVTNSMNNIGNALSAKGDFAQAISFWERALKASQEFGTVVQQAQIQNNLGIAHYNLKQYKKAKDFYGEARSMYERINSRIGLAYALTNLGEVLFAEGEYEAALGRWNEGKQLYASMDNAQALAETCLHLANVLFRIGDPSAMAAQLDEANRLIQDRKLETFSARYDYLRGLCLFAQKDFVGAEQLLTKSREAYRTERSKDMYWLSTLRLAEAMHGQGKSKEAVALISELLKTNEVKKFPMIVAEANYQTGVIAMARPEVVPEKAISFFKQGIEAIAKEPVSETTWKLTFALAREYYERGQRDRAKEFLLKTKLVVQFFLSHFQSPELKQCYLAVDQKQNVLSTIEAITKQ